MGPWGWVPCCCLRPCRRPRRGALPPTRPAPPPRRAAADDEEDQPGGGGAGGGGGPGGQGQMLYIPGLGYIPLANFPGLGGAGGRGPAAPQQQPEGEREWTALQVGAGRKPGLRERCLQTSGHAGGTGTSHLTMRPVAFRLLGAGDAGGHAGGPAQRAQRAARGRSRRAHAAGAGQGRRGQEQVRAAVLPCMPSAACAAVCMGKQTVMRRARTFAAAAAGAWLL